MTDRDLLVALVAVIAAALVAGTDYLADASGSSSAVIDFALVFALCQVFYKIGKQP